MSTARLVPLTPIDIGKLGMAVKVFLQQHYEKDKKNRYFTIEMGNLILSNQGYWQPKEQTPGFDCIHKSKQAAMRAFTIWLHRQVQLSQLDIPPEQTDNVLSTEQ